MSEAIADVQAGNYDVAADKIALAQVVEPKLSRAARKLPQTIEGLMPLLRLRQAAGPVLRQLRQSLELSQAQVAEICGVVQSNVAHWESGRQAISEDAFRRLLEHYAKSSIANAAESAGGELTPQALMSLRRALRLDQMTMAKRVGVGYSVLRGLENGGRPITLPIAKAYRELAAKHEINLDKLAA